MASGSKNHLLNRIKWFGCLKYDVFIIQTINSFKLRSSYNFFFFLSFKILSLMPISSNRSLGIQKNKLMRYKLIKELYQKHKTEDIPTTVVWRKYVYPVYPISRTTLYEILCTPITSELKKIEELMSNQERSS